MFDEDRRLNAAVKLATVALELEDLATAPRLVEEGLAQTTGTTPERRRLHARFLVARGQLRQRLGDVPGARTSFEEALAIQVPLLGAENPETMGTREQLASALARLDRLQEALAMNRDILQWRMEHQGDDHPDTIDTLLGTADLAFQAGDLERAEELITTYDEHVVRVFGPEHVLRGEAIHQRSRIASERRDFREALRLAEEYVTGLRKHHGSHAMATVRGMLWKALCQRMIGQLEDALATLESAQGTLDALEDPDPILTSRVRRNLGTVLGDLRRFDRAEAILRHAVEEGDLLFAPPSYLAAVTRNDLAMCLMMQGRADEAESLMRASLAMFEAIERPPQEIAATSSRPSATRPRWPPCVHASTSCLAERAPPDTSLTASTTPTTVGPIEDPSEASCWKIHPRPAGTSSPVRPRGTRRVATSSRRATSTS